MNVTSIGIVHVEGAETIIELQEQYRRGLHGLGKGDRIDVSYWMHQLDHLKRSTLEVHPRGDLTRPLRGVFGVRSPHRPNPIGVSQCCIRSIENTRIHIDALDAHDGSPVIDIKAARDDSALKEVIGAWGKIHNALTGILEEKIGEQGIEDYIRAPMEELGKREAGTNEQDAAAVGRRIMAFEKHWCIEGSVLYAGADRFTREVTGCPWAWFSPMSCKVLGWYMAGYCEGMNAECSYHLKKLIPEGASSCVWEIRKNKTGNDGSGNS